MDDTVILQWTFTPHDFFEEATEFNELGTTLHIYSGLAKASIQVRAFEARPEIKDDLNDSLECRFSAVQVYTHKKYSLSKPTKSIQHANGGISICELTTACSSAAVSGNMRVVGQDGTIVFDSKKERLEECKKLSELFARHRENRTLRLMRRSYKAAADYPQNEFVHLYGVADAAKQDLGKRFIKTLGLCDQWGTFERICNELPVQQGRHPGNKDPLRNATADELELARGFAMSLVKAYVRYLETHRARD